MILIDLDDILEWQHYDIEDAMANGKIQVVVDMKMVTVATIG